MKTLFTLSTSCYFQLSYIMVNILRYIFLKRYGKYRKLESRICPTFDNKNYTSQKYVDYTPWKPEYYNNVY